MKNKKSKSIILIILAVVLALAAGFCLWHVIAARSAPTPASETIAQTTAQPAASEAAAPNPQAETDVSAPEDTAEPYVSPIDFTALQEINPDIYAWLEVVGTDISYPVVQHPTDNTFYLDHDSDGNYSANGAIFSEDFNSKDMDDPVTLLYGHHMNSGAMFGNLQQYFSDPEFFDEHQLIRIYTPNAEYDYMVFAAVPFSGDHLLYWYDFTDAEEFSSFFSDVFNIRGFNALTDETYAPEDGGRVLILSTCLAGNNTQRFLVMATLSNI